MVSSITIQPYFIPRSLRFISSTNMKIATPACPTELPRVSVGGPTPGLTPPRGVPGVGPTPGLTHLTAGPGYQLTVSPG